jgi:hypothetical protein
MQGAATGTSAGGIVGQGLVRGVEERSSAVRRIASSTSLKPTTPDPAQPEACTTDDTFVST